MQFEPLNRHILIAPCEDPRAHGPIHVEGNTGVGFGIVEEMDRLSTAPFKEGDVVYFEPAAAKPLILDNEQFRLLVQEAHLLGIARCVVGKPIDATAKLPAKDGGLVVPEHVNGRRKIEV